MASQGQGKGETKTIKLMTVRMEEELAGVSGKGPWRSYDVRRGAPRI